jgi:transient receptor potential cation channel subfamily V member 5
MGNTESNVTSGVKKQAGTSTQALYNMVNLKGGGLLVDMMKRAVQSKQFAEIDHAIKTKVSQPNCPSELLIMTSSICVKVEPFLYNKGKGKYFPIAKLVLLRNKERARYKQLPEIRIYDNPDEEFDIDEHCPEVSDAEYAANPMAYKELCWNIKERGAVGETILHLCLLNATSLHADLAKRLLRFYPKLINDIYMSDEYYGESVLHLAIVNEDPAMVKFLLDAGADYHERCCGGFMCPEDQKASRNDSTEQETVVVAPFTNYEGYVYWGEYPLSFAACLGQEECYRLTLAKGADPDSKDTNGNTVLHMLVIYEKLSTFDMAFEVGSSLAIRNLQNLTPLTLAAKLSRVEMFFHILNIEREIYWQLGSITCAAYPLSQIDTIDIETGNINKDSALNLVVFGDKDEHLELLDGMLIDLLKTKWNTFVKSKFYRQFYQFTLYFLISLVAFTLRPGNFNKEKESGGRNKTMEDHGHRENATKILKLLNVLNLSQPTKHEVSSAAILQTLHLSTSLWFNLTDDYLDDGEEKDKTGSEATPAGSSFWDEHSSCRLLHMETNDQKVRLIAEFGMLLGAILYLLAAFRESRFLGYKMFVENLMTAPSRVMFLFSCCLIIIVPMMKFSCSAELEDHFAVSLSLRRSFKSLRTS